MGRMVNTRHDNVPRWLDRLVAAGTILILAVCALALYVVAASTPANATGLPPGWVEPPGECVEVEPGVWFTAGDIPLPCGPTLLELATGTTLAPIDPETGCTPAVPSDGCQPDPPPASAAQTQGCAGPAGYCTTEPPVTEPPTSTSVAPSTTSAPPSSTSTTTSSTAATSTTTSTTAAPSTSTTSVAVGPPPVPSTTVATGVTSELPVTGNSDALWQLAAAACAAGLILILVSAARRRT
jgi:hypothetical protein